MALSIEIRAPIERVFFHWTRYSYFPRLMDCVRRVKRIDERRLMWDVDIAGRQVVWEALIVEHVPNKRVRWRSIWGRPNLGTVEFAPTLSGTRVTVEIEFLPQGPLERLGTRLGFVRYQLDRDLKYFRYFIESLSHEDSDGPEVESHP